METGLGTQKVNPAPLVLPGHGWGLHPSRGGRKGTALFLRRRGPNVLCGPEDLLGERQTTEGALLGSGIFLFPGSHARGVLALDLPP